MDFFEKLIGIKIKTICFYYNDDNVAILIFDGENIFAILFVLKSGKIHGGLFEKEDFKSISWLIPDSSERNEDCSKYVVGDYESLVNFVRAKILKDSMSESKESTKH